VNGGRRLGWLVQVPWLPARLAAAGRVVAAMVMEKDD